MKLLLIQLLFILFLFVISILSLYRADCLATSVSLFLFIWFIVAYFNSGGRRDPVTLSQGMLAGLYNHFALHLGVGNHRWNDKPTRLTQTISLGLVTFLGLIGYTASYLGFIAYRYEDEQQIKRRYTEFHEQLNTEPQKAYSYMSPNYRQRCSVEEFLEEFYISQHDGWVIDHTSDLLRISSNPYLSFSVLGDRAKFHPDYKWHIEPYGPTHELIKVEGEWYFTGIYTWHFDAMSSEPIIQDCLK